MTSSVVDRQAQKYEKAEFGFWLYLMTDIILFASLFATYMVLRNNTAGSEPGSVLLDPGYALVETVILLSSSFTCGIAALSLRFRKKALAVTMLAVTLALGIAFVGLELHEFMQLVADGQSWQVNAFLSSFFTLVATHGIHITVGLIWGTVMLSYILKHGVNANTLRKYTLFSLFWHFLDLVWIFIFTIVYLGAVI